MSRNTVREKIDKIRFIELDHKPRKTLAAVKIDNCILIKFEDGSLFCSDINSRWFSPLIRYWYNDNFLKALRVLRIINTNDIKVHQKACKELDEFKKRESAREEIIRFSERHGVKITEEQKISLKFGEKKPEY